MSVSQSICPVLKCRKFHTSKRRIFAIFCINLEFYILEGYFFGPKLGKVGQKWWTKNETFGPLLNFDFFLVLVLRKNLPQIGSFRLTINTKNGVCCLIWHSLESKIDHSSSGVPSNDSKERTASMYHFGSYNVGLHSAEFSSIIIFGDRGKCSSL